MDYFKKREKGFVNLINRVLLSVIHELLPADCDFCGEVLHGNDYTRICRRCVEGLDNTFGQAVCGFCYAPLQNSVCPSCALADKIEKEREGEQKGVKQVYYFTKNTSLFFNIDEAKMFVYRYKFKGHRSHAKIIVDWSLKKHLDLFSHIDAIVPIRLGKRGLYERDFCVVDEVVKRLAKQLGLPILRVLQRNEKHYKKAQHQKSAEERQLIEGKYFYLKKYENCLKGKKVLLVDDVFTTGATLNYAAKLITEWNKDCVVEAYTFLKTILD